MKRCSANQGIPQILCIILSKRQNIEYSSVDYKIKLEDTAVAVLKFKTEALAH